MIQFAQALYALLSKDEQEGRVRPDYLLGIAFIAVLIIVASSFFDERLRALWDLAH